MKKKLEVLFCLQTQEEKLSADLRGAFSFLDGVLCFVPQEIAPKGLPYCCERGEGNNRLLPLLEHLARKAVTVILHGFRIAEKPLYPVTSMELSDDGGPPISKYNGLTPLWLKTCIESLRCGQAVCPEAPGFENLAEIEAFNSVCNHTYPSWLAKAISRNITLARERGSAHQHAEVALKCLANIDWRKQWVQATSLDEAKERLDRQLFGMDKIKQRMLEIVAKVRRTGDFSAQPPILITGPPGVGKTSVAKAFAKLFDQIGVIWLDMSVIGDHPEVIAGSQRVFANATTGSVASGMFEHRSANAIVIINEIDKAFCQHADGMAATALLSLLDGQGFQENFLEVRLPTDGMLLIATANDTSRLPDALRSRFVEIEVGGYSVGEKKAIWTGYALPKALKQWKIPCEQVHFSDKALESLIVDYATEPGARDLIQMADTLAAASERHLRENGEDHIHTFESSELRYLLGPPKTRRRETQPGVAAAFVYQDSSAYETWVQASSAPGEGAFRVLGASLLQREYLQAAFECVRGMVMRDRPNFDITVFLREPTPCDKNLLSFAAFAAILSRLTGVDLGKTAFIGGIDLAGTLYFDESNILPLLKALQRSDVRTIFAPAGTIEMIDIQAPDLCPQVKVIESRNAMDLLSLLIPEEDLFDINLC